MEESAVATSFTSFSKDKELPDGVALDLDDIKLEKQGIDNKGFQVGDVLYFVTSKTRHTEILHPY